MLQPKRTNYRKEHRGRMNGIRTRGATMVYGEFGLKAEGPGWVTAREIEAARRAITGYVQRGGQLWVRLFPAKPVRGRPADPNPERSSERRILRKPGQRPSSKLLVARVITGRMRQELIRRCGLAK